LEWTPFIAHLPCSLNCMPAPPATTNSSGGGTGTQSSNYFELFPSINVEKVASTLFLSSGSGPITYTYVVTNVGKVALNTIWVKDDKCTSVQYVSGDTDGDISLDLNETWTYTCTKTVTQTETNVATAHGWGVGVSMDVYDTATSTVVVSAPAPAKVLGVSTTTVTTVPSFPNTGLPPRGTGILWSVLVTFSGILLAVLISAVMLKKAYRITN